MLDRKQLHWLSLCIHDPRRVTHLAFTSHCVITGQQWRVMAAKQKHWLSPTSDLARIFTISHRRKVNSYLIVGVFGRDTAATAAGKTEHFPQLPLSQSVFGSIISYNASHSPFSTWRQSHEIHEKKLPLVLVLFSGLLRGSDRDRCSCRWELMQPGIDYSTAVCSNYINSLTIVVN